MGKRLRRWALPLALLATLVLVAVCALVPVWVFQAQDAGLFAKPHAYPDQVGRLRVAPEDVPVVRALRAYAEGYEADRAAGLAEENMVLARQSYGVAETLMPRVEAYLEALDRAGALPGEAMDTLRETLLLRQDVRFTHEMDSRGMEYIVLECDYEFGATAIVLLTVETGSDRLVRLEMHLPFGPLGQQVESERLARGFAGYLGLDAAEDFRMVEQERYGAGPSGEQAGETGDTVQLYADSLKLAVAVQQFDAPGYTMVGIEAQSLHMVDVQSLYGWAASTLPSASRVVPAPALTG